MFQVYQKFHYEHVKLSICQNCLLNIKKTSWTPSPRRARRDHGYIDDDFDERVGVSGPMDFVRQEFGRFGRPQSK